MLRIILLSLAIGVLQIRADCNVCSGITNAACVGTTQFQFCVDNKPNGTINSCPSGNVCTGEPQICQTNATLVSCDSCGSCNSAGVFACLGVRTFALCLGSQSISGLTGSCAPDRVCNIDNPNICGTADGGYQATCPLADDELLSTTAFPPGNYTANEYCNLIQQVGRFPYGTTAGTSCKKYVSCNVNASIWYGAIYTCPGSTYFQPTTRNCNTTLPSTCTTAVRSLKLYNLQLI